MTETKRQYILDVLEDQYFEELESTNLEDAIEESKKNLIDAMKMFHEEHGEKMEPCQFNVTCEETGEKYEGTVSYNP